MSTGKKIQKKKKVVVPEIVPRIGGRPGGRPTKYNSEMIGRAQDYLEACVDEERAGGKIRVRLPTVEGLANFLKINKDTLYEWAKKHKEFSVVLDHIKQEQSNRLIQKGLSGEYSPVIAKLLLSSKHGYAEKSEQKIEGTLSLSALLGGGDLDKPKEIE